MSSIYYRKITGGAVDNVVVFRPNNDNPIYEADSSHPHWNDILEGLSNDDEAVFDLFDVQGGLVKRLKTLSDRVSWNGKDILFDGDVQDTAIANHLRRSLEQGLSDYKPVVRFWEKVSQNPSKRSRKQLFTWLQAHDFTITEDGDIVGYKGVATDYKGGHESVNSGTAFVDGKEITGKIPNVAGTIVTMPRSEVKNDPNVACHKGLHVGDWSYASTFGGQTTLEVHVNPRDVVSIPKDTNATKMRCCKYKVVSVAKSPYATAVLSSSVPAWSGDVGYSPEDF